MFHRDWLFADDDPNTVAIHRERSDFGRILVEDYSPPFAQTSYRRLLYSGTLHDVQFLTSDLDLAQLLALTLPVNHGLGTVCLHQVAWHDSNTRLIPLTYYHRSGPLGQAFPVVCQGEHERAPVAFIGLGGGSVAAYARAGQPITFYEIDPVLIRIVRDHFTFLRDCCGKMDMVVGEPRAKMAEAADGAYRLIVVNPVGGIYTPHNCLTREAVQLFMRKLSPGGVMALHVSHRELEVGPVLGNIASDLKLAALYQYDNDDEHFAKNTSEWVLIARQPADFGTLRRDERWVALKADPTFPLWTDAEQNVHGARRRP
jgi:hypothetical protein